MTWICFNGQTSGLLVCKPGRCPKIYSLVSCEWRLRYIWNRALVRCLAGIDYEMPELISNDLVMGSGLCPWSLTVVSHVLLNSSVQAALMCLDSLKLLSCVQTPYLVSRGMQIPYPAAVNLLEGLGVSQVVPEYLVLTLRFCFVGTRWHTTLIDGYTRRACLWTCPAGLHHHHRIPLKRPSERGTRS
ncbi:hypothetical protein M9H77_26494 [Catharanthus roseus]|uniref:Uncharacterized protein n=1 Tax=Catharanthus roseus TaxID=4058 RepID=A0ACC0AAC2_CATRO|nr:hypothetical protein M9H77_26494 [Catharanthus roseus]